MALVTRILTNTGDPITYPDGTLAANVQLTFTLVDFEKRQPISLFDAASGGGEYVPEKVVTVNTNSSGVFTVNLWPNVRGELATLYKVAIPGVVLKPFYIEVSEGAGSLSLVSARVAAEAIEPQTLSLFQTVLTEIAATLATATAPATETLDGLMSAADKTKLDNLAAPDLSALASLDSPALTGMPTAPTAALGVNTTQIANTAFVAAALAALVGSSPTTLDTLNELAAALGNDPNFATTVTTALGLKAPAANPVFTGLLKSLGNAVFGTSGSADNGLAKVQSSNGITLGNSTNANGTVLDWYEEGTITPTASFGGNSVGVAYNGSNTGTFTRIGNRVFFNLCLSLSSKGISAGGLVIGGLPYPVAAANGEAGSTAGMSFASSVSAVPMVSIGAMSGGTKTGVALYKVASGASTQFTQADCLDGTYVVVSGHYQT